AGRQFQVFDAATGAEVGQIANEGGHVISLEIAPDSRWLAAGAWGKSVQTKLPDGRTRISSEKNQLVSLWDLTTRQLRHQFVLLDERVGPVAFAPDGALLAAAVGGPKPRLRLWNTEAAKEVGLVQGFHGNVRSMAFSPDGKKLITGMQDT